MSRPQGARRGHQEAMGVLPDTVEEVEAVLEEDDGDMVTRPLKVNGHV